MRDILRYIVSAAAAVLIISCEKGSSTRYEEKLVLYCYAMADSTIDSLYLSRSGGVNERINMENLGVSGALITLLCKTPSDSSFSTVGTLSEYPGRNGLYFLPDADFADKFRPMHTYRLDVYHEDHGRISAQTVCPPELGIFSVKNVEKNSEMVPAEEDPLAVDTLYYRRGDGFDDFEMVRCRFDSLLILADQRMASYRIVPDEISRTDTSFWLEDTTETVWNKYPAVTKLFKNKEKYGKDFTEYYLRSMSIYWYALYHEGPHTVIFSSKDRSFRSYMETLYGGEERFTNVEGGYGLFTISNSSGQKSRYRVYVKSLENKYP